jgi:hypothetical protein
MQVFRISGFQDSADAPHRAPTRVRHQPQFFRERLRWPPIFGTHMIVFLF